MLEQVSLTNELRTLYHDLIGGRCVNVTVNGVIPVNIKLFGNDNEEKYLSSKKNIMQYQYESREDFIKNGDTRFYDKTLLLVAEADFIVLLLDKSENNNSYGVQANTQNDNASVDPKLIKFLKKVSPLINFYELSLILDEPTHDVRLKYDKRDLC